MSFICWNMKMDHFRINYMAITFILASIAARNLVKAIDARDSHASISGNEHSVSLPENYNKLPCVRDRQRRANDATYQSSAANYKSVCNEPCRCCTFGSCNTTIGHCSINNQCEWQNSVPPLCTKELEEPIILAASNTSVIVVQHVDITEDIAKSDGTEVVLMVEEPFGKNFTLSLLITETEINRSTYGAGIIDLQPGSFYKMHTIVIVRSAAFGGEGHSPTNYFHMTRRGVLSAIRSFFTTDQKHCICALKASDEFKTQNFAPIVHNLRVLHTTDTTVELEWQTHRQNRDDSLYFYFINMKINMMPGCGRRNVTLPQGILRTSSRKTRRIDNLHPYSYYEVSVFAISEGDYGTPAKRLVRTNATDVPTSVVSNLRYDAQENILRWEEPQDCTTITGPIWGTRLFFYRAGSNEEPPVTTQTALTFINLSNLTLRANATYLVRAHVIRNSKTYKHSDKYEETNFRTRLAAPSSVTNLRIDRVDSDTSTVVVRWEPPKSVGNEIKYYRVLIKRQDEPWAADMTPSDKEREWNITLPLNLGKTDISIQVYPVNKDGSQPKTSLTLRFDPVTSFKLPSRPLNLRRGFKGNGIVILTWYHPSVSYIPIKQFDIQIEVLESKLLDFQAKNFPIMNVTYPVKERRLNYLKHLYLLTSTSYRISLTALNSENRRSSQAQGDISVPAGSAFQHEETLRSTPNRESFDIEVPGVENATENTIVSIFVEGYTKCTTTGLSLQQSEPKKWVVHEYQLETSKSQTSTIDPEHGVGKNCILQREEPYYIRAVLRDTSGQLDELISSSLAMLHEKPHNLVWTIFFPILVICLLPIIIWYIKSRKFTNRTRPPSYFDITPLSPTAIHFNNSTPRHSETNIYTVPNATDSRTVSIQYFEEYTKNAAASGLLYSQFMLLPRGMTKPCESGMLPENIAKNRYRNLIAYDDNRVVLKKIPGDPHSDYINASYIRGYRKENAYIATQGPKPNTIKDFWRMIWQEDVRVICMMSNVLEGVTKHSEKYWPDLGCRIKHGNIFISNTNQQVFADFTFRKFRLSFYGDTREVTHLQYTGWPVLGMPSAQSFVAYLKKLVQTPSGDGPIVVHCHAGDGRSGVIILCDISLRQAIAESTIDVTAVTSQMRDRRANMVATPQQYLFAHVAIVESLMTIPTQLPCTEIFTSRLQKMKLQLIADLQRLEDTMWQEQALDAFASQEPSTPVEYTTIDNIIPDISGVPDLDRSKTFDRRGGAIDVVSVDGLRLKNQYLASWLPPPLTLANFWKFVAAENIQLIIILQCSDPKNTTCSDIIPDESILRSMPYTTVEPKTVPEKGEYFTSETLLLRDTSEKITRSRTVTVLTCDGWQSGEFGKPPAPVALVSLWRASEKIPRKEAETLVLCNNGSSCCGLYLAMCFLLERMAVEGECDVISAVRKVRKSNLGFVLSKNHCEYLFDAAEVYAEDFKCYANFN